MYQSLEHGYVFIGKVHAEVKANNRGGEWSCEDWKGAMLGFLIRVCNPYLWCDKEEKEGEHPLELSHLEEGNRSQAVTLWFPSFLG